MVNQFAAVYAHVEKLTPFIEVGVQLEQAESTAGRVFRRAPSPLYATNNR